MRAYSSSTCICWVCANSIGANLIRWARFRNLLAWHIIYILNIGSFACFTFTVKAHQLSSVQNTTKCWVWCWNCNVWAIRCCRSWYLTVISNYSWLLCTAKSIILSITYSKLTCLQRISTSNICTCGYSTKSIITDFACWAWICGAALWSSTCWVDT